MFNNKILYYTRQELEAKKWIYWEDMVILNNEWVNKYSKLEEKNKELIKQIEELTSRIER